MELILVQMLVTTLSSMIGKCLEEHLVIWLGYNRMTSWNLANLQ